MPWKCLVLFRILLDQLLVSNGDDIVLELLVSKQTSLFPGFVLSIVVSWSEIRNLSQYLYNFILADFGVSLSYKNIQPIKAAKVKFMTCLSSSLYRCFLEDIKDLVHVVSVDLVGFNVVSLAAYLLGTLLLHYLAVYVLAEKVWSLGAVGLSIFTCLLDPSHILKLLSKLIRPTKQTTSRLFILPISSILLILILLWKASSLHKTHLLSFWKLLQAFDKGFLH